MHPLGWRHCFGGESRKTVLHDLAVDAQDRLYLAADEGGLIILSPLDDSVSKTVIQTGFRNAHAFDGKKTYPVQIAYIRSHCYDGERKWTDYDWSTDQQSDRFLNKPTNNMADSRGDRCAIGRDRFNARRTPLAIRRATNRW